MLWLCPQNCKYALTTIHKQNFHFGAASASHWEGSGIILWPNANWETVLIYSSFAHSCRLQSHLLHSHPAPCGFVVFFQGVLSTTALPFILSLCLGCTPRGIDFSCIVEQSWKIHSILDAWSEWPAHSKRCGVAWQPVLSCSALWVMSFGIYLLGQFSEVCQLVSSAWESSQRIWDPEMRCKQHWFRLLSCSADVGHTAMTCVWLQLVHWIKRK